MQFVRRYGVRIVIGAVLLAMAWGATNIYMPYAHEQRLARKLKDVDVELNYWYHGPEWVPQSIRPRLHFLQRVASFDLRVPELIMPRELDAAAISKTPVKWRAIGDSELAEISEFKHATMLSLNVRRISDSGLAHLGKMSCVWFIWLGEDDFNSLDQSPQRFAEGPKITAAGLRHLSGMQRLHSLCFHGVHITDESLVGLAGMSQLRYLSLDYTAVTDAGVGILAKEILHLANLDLRGTKVTDAGLVHLSDLKSLSELNLSGTRITDAGLVSLKGLSSLSRLTLVLTDTTSEGRAMLRKALPNCTITPEP